MIFATVGTQLPFPRLLIALDKIAATHGLAVLAQTCGDLPDLRNIDQRPFLSPAEFGKAIQDATLIVGHAGIGTIISAGKAGKPLVIFPRRASLAEHRNDHQVATAKAVQSRSGVCVAWDEDQLADLITVVEHPAPAAAESSTRPALIAALREFVVAGGVDAHPSSS